MTPTNENIIAEASIELVNFNQPVNKNEVDWVRNFWAEDLWCGPVYE